MYCGSGGTGLLSGFSRPSAASSSRGRVKSFERTPLTMVLLRQRATLERRQELRSSPGILPATVVEVDRVPARGYRSPRHDRAVGRRRTILSPCRTRVRTRAPREKSGSSLVVPRFFSGETSSTQFSGKGIEGAPVRRTYTRQGLSGGRTTADNDCRRFATRLTSADTNAVGLRAFFRVLQPSCVQVSSGATIPPGENHRPSSGCTARRRPEERPCRTLTPPS